MYEVRSCAATDDELGQNIYILYFPCHHCYWINNKSFQIKFAAPQPNGIYINSNANVPKIQDFD